MDKVSIIVPIYKVEQYLPRCIKALLGQTYQNVEVVLIDDGSEDGSGRICDAFAGQDTRVRVIHQPNQGVSAARNAGLDAATGNWVCFCDGDDWYEPEYVEKMLRCAEEKNADYIICNYQIVATGRTPLVSGSVDALRSCCERNWVIALGPTSSCTHMIRRELFEKSGVRYPVGCRLVEELPVIPVLAKYAARIALVDEPLYNYFQRGDGTSASNISAQSKAHFRMGWSAMCQGLGNEYRQEAEYHAIYGLLYGELLRLCKEKAKDWDIREEIRHFEEEFPDYRGNPYIRHMGRAKELFLYFAHKKWIMMLRLLAWVHGKIVG